MRIGPVMGIDPSLRGFCTCVWHPSWDEPIFSKSTTDPKKYGDDFRSRKKRICDNIESSVKLAAKYAPSLILIEGYSFGHRRLSFPAIEVAVVARWEIEGYADEFYEIPPTRLKKFATGKGNADKSSVVSSLTKRYGLVFESDDHADAYGLVRLGAVVAGYVEPTTKAEAQIVEAVRDV